MENLSRFAFGLRDAVKKTITKDSSESSDDITKRKSMIYGKLF